MDAQPRPVMCRVLAQLDRPVDLVCPRRKENGCSVFVAIVSRDVVDSRLNGRRPVAVHDPAGEVFDVNLCGGLRLARIVVGRLCPAHASTAAQQINVRCFIYWAPISFLAQEPDLTRGGAPR